MPVTIKSGNLKYKNSLGQYVGINCVSDSETADQIAAIEAKGEEVLESIPSDYSELVEEVNGKYEKPASGIPASDLAEGAIPDEVIVSATQPSDEGNKLWINSAEIIENSVPTVAEMQAADAAKADKVSNATSGNFAALDENGNLVDSGHSPDDYLPGTDVTDAVSDWLDEHPEATTTVEDGSITKAKLNSSLQDKVLIRSESEKTYTHNKTSEKIIFYPDANADQTSVRYADCENLLDNVINNVTYGGISKTLSGRFAMLSGTANGGFTVFETTSSTRLSKLAGKTLHFYFYVKKAEAYGVNTYWFLQVNGSDNLVRTYSLVRNQLYHSEVTFPETLTKLLLKYNSLSGATFTTGDCMWVGLYENELTDTEQVLASGDDPYEISVSGLQYVDTALHESTIISVESTKDYVDNHIPDIKAYWNDEIYALPEKFGAVGDGVTDDTQAIADCLTYAATAGKPVKGFGKYKVSSTITIRTRYSDVYLREIVYTGNNVAVSLENTDMVFEFHRIQSGGIGVSFGGSNPYARRCQVRGNEINSVSHCLETNDYTLYCTCEIRYLSTSDGDCIHHTYQGAFGGNEFVYRGSSCSCPNGYVAYGVGDSKFYDFTIEGNCKYGFRNPLNSVCVGIRHREQIDAMSGRINGTEGKNNGPLIIFTGMQSPSGFKYITSDPIHPWSIDVSAMSGFDPIQDGGEWRKSAFNGISIDVPVLGSSGTLLDSGRNSCVVIADKVYIIGGNKVFVPAWRKTVTITDSEYDYRVFDAMDDTSIKKASKMDLGTDFLLDVAHTDIYFGATFGAVGYNDLTLTQANGNTATIYDKLGNVLFDGTNEGDGKWRFQCIIDRSSKGRLDSQSMPNWWCYDGTNEFWEIEKIG